MEGLQHTGLPGVITVPFPGEVLELTRVFLNCSVGAPDFGFSIVHSTLCTCHIRNLRGYQEFFLCAINIARY